MIPHATLQPSASISIVRTLPRLAPPALNVHVSVRTMMSPNKNSEILSAGSKTRLGFLAKSVDISTVRSPFSAGDGIFRWADSTSTVKGQ